MDEEGGGGEAGGCHRDYMWPTKHKILSGPLEKKFGNPCFMLTTVLFNETK